jgi:hypothetical protein
VGVGRAHDRARGCFQLTFNEPFHAANIAPDGLANDVFDFCYSHFPISVATLFMRGAALA